MKTLLAILMLAFCASEAVAQWDPLVITQPKKAKKVSTGRKVKTSDGKYVQTKERRKIKVKR